MTEIALAPPLVLHHETVRPEWIDYNGHMNVAYYVMAFDHATDGFFDSLGVGAEYCRREGQSLFAVEQRIAYKREVRDGERLVIATQLLGFDEKRLHFFQRMAPEDGDFIAATMESLGVHVDMTARRASAFPEAAHAALERLRTLQADLPRPVEAGRAIRAVMPPAA